MTLRINTLRANTVAEGPGHRFCVWTQGCTRRCPGCFARDTWDPDGGTKVSVAELCALLDTSLESAHGLEGITLLGGEPFLQARPLARFSAYARKRGLSVFCFTGYTIEQLQASDDEGVAALLSTVDVLADGPFVLEQRSFQRPWVGSRNQRFHFLTDRYAPSDFTNQRNRVEVRLHRDGSVTINGMADFFGPEEVLPRAQEERT